MKPLWHARLRVPFGRLLLVQARIEQAVLVMNYRAISRYEVDLLW